MDVQTGRHRIEQMLEQMLGNWPKAARKQGKCRTQERAVMLVFLGNESGLDNDGSPLTGLKAVLEYRVG
jgi:hypothetical protein